MADPRSVTAVVVNWNGAEDLRRCVPTLLDQDYPSLDILVVDNGSSDESAEVVAGFGVGWLPLGSNRGLAAALHEGARSAAGTYLLFLNNDMSFERSFVSELVSTLESNPDAFGVDAKQLHWTSNEVAHCRTYLSPCSGENAAIPGWRFDQEDVDVVSECTFASAANTLVRADRYNEAGGWDPGFPIGFEDVDLALRAWALGYPSLYVPTAVARHDVSASARSEEGSRFRRRGEAIGVLILAEKHLPPAAAFAITSGFARSILVSLVHGRWRDARMMAEVLIRGVRALPRSLRERKMVARASGLSPVERMARLAARTAPAASDPRSQPT